MNSTEKKIIFDEIEKVLASKLEIIESSYMATSSYSQSEDIRSEGKYDARAIEAGMLASAQKKRFEELKLEVEQFKLFRQQDFNSVNRVSLGRVVAFTQKAEKMLKTSMRYVLICPYCVGLEVQIRPDVLVLVISPASTLGEALIGAEVEEVVELELQDKVKELVIHHIY